MQCMTPRMVSYIAMLKELKNLYIAEEIPPGAWSGSTGATAYDHLI